LALIGDPVYDRDEVLCTLTGLHDEFKMFLPSLTNHPPMPYFEELNFSLIQHENLVLKKASNNSNDVSHEVFGC